MYKNFDSGSTFRCGYIAIIGRPNVGKSTLLNRILGQKISITARKPQTTRHRLLGIKTTAEGQFVYVDTPGLHTRGKRALNRYLNRTASRAMADVDVIVFVAEKTTWNEEDQYALQKALQYSAPVILVLNKTDKVKEKEVLLPHIEMLKNKATFVSVIPLSAATGENVDVLERQLLQLLPLSPPFFPDDQSTDRSERFLAAELVREKLIRNLGQEVPHQVAVQIDQFKHENNLRRIHATIWVEKPGQKTIIIGKNGLQLKNVGQAARLDMEKLFGSKVFLQLWVKVKQGWSDSERALQSLGYSEDV
jgi:GTP-binding protein Era